MKRVFIIFSLLIITAVTSYAYEFPYWQYFPLSVYIEANPKKPIVQKAFNTWQSATGFTKFRFVDTEKKIPHIIVKFSDNNPNTSGSQFENAVGLAHSYTPTGYYAKAVITIWLTYPGTDKFMTDTQIYSIALHEIGHALGLIGHSPYKNDIMYFQEHGQTTLSDNDIARLKKKYSP